LTEAFLFDAIRTPRGRGRKDGALHGLKPVQLLVQLLKALQQRQRLDTSRVDDVVIGCVTPIGEQGACIARSATLAAGWSWEAPGIQLNRFCGSGLEAVNLAAQKVRSGWENLVVAGGVESMSRVPLGSDGGELYENADFIPQGVSADLLASLDGFERPALDRFALLSHQKAAAAQHEGRFSRSIVPVRDASGQVVLEQDEAVRKASTLEALAGLKPAFAEAGSSGYDEVALRRYPRLKRVDHVHTAGNSSGIVDGAALVLIGNERAAKEYGLLPRARIASSAVCGSEPTVMLTGPGPAARKALARAGLEADQIDLFEVNEAFSVVPLHFMRELGVPADKVNVNGGAIALGHPLGATGAMLAGTLIDEMERRQLRYGLATLCLGGGMGIATVFERV
jgi:acetyl-CoA C-acetyltransferase